MRTRIFYNHLTGERTELSEDDMAKRFLAPDCGPAVVPDLSSVYKEGGILSPIDGSFITSRSQLRRHNNTHQVRCGGDFKPGEIVGKEKSRVESQRQIIAREKVRFEWQ